MYDENLYADRAIQAGACAYVPKYAPIEQLIETIRRVLAGGLEDVTRKNRSGSGSGRRGSDSPMARLSNREIEVFRMVGQGLATREIATSLFVSHKTIETHRENIKKKLQLKNASELLIRATAWVLDENSSHKPSGTPSPS
jgi:DNA-binding NarL/FixJ family response regulator